MLAFTAEQLATFDYHLPRVERLIEVDDGVAYFAAGLGTGPELWRSDGTVEGTWGLACEADESRGEVSAKVAVRLTGQTSCGSCGLWRRCRWLAQPPARARSTR